MNRILSIAILLLNLFVANNVQVQSYSSELGVGDLIKKTWDNAQNSNADIYAEVYDDWGYEFNDYSEIGDFSQEVLFSDGTRILYGLDLYGEKINNYASESVAYTVGTSYKSDSYYANSSSLLKYDLIIPSNGNYAQTLRRVTNLMSSRSSVTGNETVAYRLIDGNYVIIKDGNNTRTEADVTYSRVNGIPSYDCNGYYFPIEDFYHSHPYVNTKEAKNPLYISTFDVDTVNRMEFDHFYIVNNGNLYDVYDFRKFGQSVIYKFNKLY